MRIFHKEVERFGFNWSNDSSSDPSLRYPWRLAIVELYCKFDCSSLRNMDWRR